MVVSSFSRLSLKQVIHGCEVPPFWDMLHACWWQWHFETSAYRYLIGSLHADVNLIRSGHYIHFLPLKHIQKTTSAKRWSNLNMFEGDWIHQNPFDQSRKSWTSPQKHRIHRNVSSNYNRIVHVIFRWHQGNDIYALDRNPYHLPTLVGIMNFHHSHLSSQFVFYVIFS